MITPIRFNGPMRQVSRAAKSGESAAAKGTFSETAATGGAAQSGATKPATPLTSLDALIALQTVDDPAGRRAKMLERGDSLLNELEKLRLDILAGRVPRDTQAAHLPRGRCAVVDDQRHAEQ